MTKDLLRFPEARKYMLPQEFSQTFQESEYFLAEYFLNIEEKSVLSISGSRHQKVKGLYSLENQENFFKRFMKMKIIRDKDKNRVAFQVNPACPVITIIIRMGRWEFFTLSNYPEFCGHKACVLQFSS